MPQTEFKNLIKAISQAIKDAQAYIEHYTVEIFSEKFTEEKDEKAGTSVLRPKMIRLPIPDSKGEYAEQEIPIVSLMNHHALNLDEVRLKMQVSGSWNEESGALQVNIEPIRHKKESNNGKEVAFTEIELVFRRGDAPEGIFKVLKEHHREML